MSLNETAATSGTPAPETWAHIDGNNKIVIAGSFDQACASWWSSGKDGCCKKQPDAAPAPTVADAPRTYISYGAARGSQLIQDGSPLQPLGSLEAAVVAFNRPGTRPPAGLHPDMWPCYHDGSFMLLRDVRQMEKDRLAKAPPVMVQADVRKDSITMTGKAGTVSAVAAVRVARHEALLSAMGIALPPPIYAAGSRVNSIGVANFRSMRNEWAEMPETAEACESVAKQIQAEGRDEIDISPRDLRMDDAGSLVVPGMGRFVVEDFGLRDVCSAFRVDPEHDSAASFLSLDDSTKLFPRGAGLMAEMPPDLRASVFNRLIGRSDPKQTVKLRTRLGADGKRGVFGVVGPRYGVFDADQILGVLARAHDGDGSRAEIVYDPASTNLRVRAVWAADNVVDFSAGDVFKVAAEWRSNDRGGGSIRGGGAAWRNRCLNLIIIGTGSNLDLVRITHKGSMNDAVQEIRDGAARIQAGFAPFLEEWGYLRSVSVDEVELWGQSFENVPVALAWAAENGHINDGVRRDVMAQALLTGFMHEQGETLADMINAITRTHSDTLLSDIETSLLQREAGELVHVFAAEARAAI